LIEKATSFLSIHQGSFVLQDIYYRKGERFNFMEPRTITFERAWSYWNDEEQTSKVVKADEDGTLWMHTGDEGIMDDEGYLRSEEFRSISSNVALIFFPLVVGRIKVWENC
jgi:hypothetical protein